MIIDCDLIIERLDDEGKPTGEVIDQSKEEKEAVEPVDLKVGAKWPFGNTTEGNKE